jgi:hypothetical protein
MKKPKKQSTSALLANLKKECAQPRMAKSARTGYVKWTATQMTTRRFESKPEWRATIRRSDDIAFILEGHHEEQFYEYPADWTSGEGFRPIEIEGATLRSQLEAGQIKLLKGTLLL